MNVTIIHVLTIQLVITMVDHMSVPARLVSQEMDMTNVNVSYHSTRFLV